MTYFTESFHKGISAAKNAERNKEEVNAVFAEMNEQLSSATENKIAIFPKETALAIRVVKDLFTGQYSQKMASALVAEFLRTCLRSFCQ
ncbi:MAG: hypothetical protein P4L91_19720 [Burkholderiaceae bacterium]|nr:hypothetical protein [Burkholderiaceae bacterium]